MYGGNNVRVCTLYIINIMRIWTRNIALLLILAAISAVRAADFQMVAPSGQTLYFNIVAGGVVVTYPSSTISPTQGWNGYTRPVGALTIPATVSHGGTVYDVVAVNSYAFYECVGLTSVVVPEGVTAVRASAFRGCSSMTTITLPSTLDSIYGYSLAYCSALNTINVGSAIPPACLDYAFSNTILSAVALHVPCGSTAVWSAATPWSQCGSITDVGCMIAITASPNYAVRGSVSGSGNYTPGVALTLNATAADGFFFVCWNDGDTLNPRIVTAVENCTYTAFFFAFRRDTLYEVDTFVVTIHDTVPIYDTITVVDSVLPTFYRVTVTSGDASHGIAAGNAVVPAGTEMEIAAVPLEGNRFLRWDDSNTDNPRTVTVTGNMSFTALFETLGTHVVGTGLPWTAVVDGRDIVVDGAEGHRLRIFSADGRELYNGCVQGKAMRFRCMAAGAYLLSVDGCAARKVIIN